MGDVSAVLANKVIASADIAVDKRLSGPSIWMYWLTIAHIVERVSILAGAGFEDSETMRNNEEDGAFIVISETHRVSIFDIPLTFLRKFPFTVIGCSV